jgi:hypothetical protein
MILLGLHFFGIGFVTLIFLFIAYMVVIVIANITETAFTVDRMKFLDWRWIPKFKYTIIGLVSVGTFIGLMIGLGYLVSL